MVQSITIDHSNPPSSYRTRIPIESGTGFFTEFWYDFQALDVAHWLCDSFADVIAPVSFVLSVLHGRMGIECDKKEQSKKRGNVKLKGAQGLLPGCSSRQSPPRSSLGSTTTSSISVDVRKFKPKNFVTV